MVFRKRGWLCQHEQWSYNDESFEIVDKMLVGKALKVMNCIVYNLKKFDFTAQSYFQLFDVIVSYCFL